MSCPKCQPAECTCGQPPAPPPVAAPPPPDPNPPPPPGLQSGVTAPPPEPVPLVVASSPVAQTQVRLSPELEKDAENKRDDGDGKKNGQAKAAPADDGNDAHSAKGKKEKDKAKLFSVKKAEKKSSFGGVSINQSGKLQVESKFDFRRVDAEQVAVGDGNNVVAINIGGATPEGSKAVKRSYLEVVSEFHLRAESRLHKFEAAELTGHFQHLEESRLLVVNCFDEDLADASATALVERLGAARDLQKFYLDCDRNELEESELTIELFVRGDEGAKSSAVVFVDASGTKGTPFIESLLGKWQTAEGFKQKLRDGQLWLICRGNSAHLRKRVNEERQLFFFPCWEIDCFDELLKHHFSEGHQSLKARIVEQRAKGQWAKDESAFWLELTELVKGGRLKAEVEKRERNEGTGRAVADARASFVKAHFKGGESIKDTMLYVAANFPDLNPHEFNRVVSALLEGLTTKVAVPAPKVEGDAPKAEATAEKRAPTQNRPGEGGPEFVWEERSLTQTWQDTADELLAECGLEVITGKEAGRRIEFRDSTLRQYLREYLETEKGFFLKKQFGRIQRLGLLFDRSVNVNEGVIDITVRMALESPETFGRDWLFDIVTVHSALLEAVSGEAEERDGTTYRPALPADLAAAMRVVYSTVARLVRRMLEHPHLEKTINDLFAQLMASAQHEAVLEIVRRLQTTQQFELRWVRQLFDQGGEIIQLRTYAALYERVRQRDAGIYEVLQSLESWLPEREREPFTYSPSNEFAMRLLFEYCLLTTAQFDSKFYGSWPCRYPLLATPGLDTAEGGRATHGNFSLLTNWLFHPGLREVVTDDSDESLNVSLGALLAEWAVILLGRDVSAGETNGDGGHAQPAAEAAFDLLLRKVISVTTPAQQKELIACWEELADYFLELVNTPGLQSGGPRRRLSRRRNWVRHLIKRFKALRRKPD